MDLVVLGEPIPKLRARTTYQDGKAWTYTPEKSRDYQNVVRLLAMNLHEECIPRGRPVRLDVTFFLEGDQRKRVTGRPDLVNLVAAVADGLERVAYENDSQIVELRVTKKVGDPPRAVIRVQQIEGV